MKTLILVRTLFLCSVLTLSLACGSRNTETKTVEVPPPPGVQDMDAKNKEITAKLAEEMAAVVSSTSYWINMFFEVTSSKNANILNLSHEVSDSVTNVSSDNIERNKIKCLQTIDHRLLLGYKNEYSKKTVFIAINGWSALPVDGKNLPAEPSTTDIRFRVDYKKSDAMGKILKKDGFIGDNASDKCSTTFEYNGFKLSGTFDCKDPANVIPISNTQSVTRFSGEFSCYPELETAR